MSETPKQLELIEGFYSFVERVADLLNTEIVAAIGIQADWDHWVGAYEIPEAYAENFSPERFKRLSDLWTLREAACGYSCDLSEDAPADWANNLLTVLGYELKDNQIRTARIDELERTCKSLNTYVESYRNQLCEAQAKHAKELAQLRKTNESYFNQFKADVLIALKALEQVAIASIRRDTYSPRQERHARLEKLGKSLQDLSSECLESNKSSLIRELESIGKIQERDQCLTHRERDERLKHLQQIIANVFRDFSDRQSNDDPDGMPF